MNSILDTIKKLLGIDPEDTAFDTDIIVAINTAFNTLTQLGVGPEEGFSIYDNSSEWNDFSVDINKMQMVKSYIFYKTKIVFDPSLTSSVNEIYKEQIQELEWRLNVQCDKGGN